MHRDYDVLGTVQVKLDDSGLEINNPGGFVRGIGPDNLLDAAPKSRNPLLADTVKRIGLAERTGRGVDHIFEEVLRYGRSAPDYSRSCSEWVSIHLAAADADHAFMRMLLEHADKTGRAMPLDGLLVLACLRTERRLAAAGIASAVPLPGARIRASLERLVESGLVDAHGAGASRMYTLGAEMRGATEDAAGRPVRMRPAESDRAQRERLVLQHLAAHDSIRTQDAMALCRLGRGQAYRLLSGLVRQGKIRRAGAGRSTFYLLSR